MRKTKHEKDLELAKAGATKYGIYINGGDIKPLTKALKEVGNVLETILHSDSSETTKKEALRLVGSSIPTVSNVNILLTPTF